MKLLYKQLTKEIVKNKIFIALLLILTVFTSFMFFFVHFSIDGNRQILDALPTLNENQRLYINALSSNTILARNFLVVLIGLTSFVFGMFFYRFFKANRKQIGCLKSIGFKDRALQSYFVSLTAIISFCGAIVGLGAGYFFSDILIDGNSQSYSMTGLVKGLSTLNIYVGLFVPTIAFCMVSFFSYHFIRGKESAILISGTNSKPKFSLALRFANRLVNIFPIKDKLRFRIALRKPVSVLLICIAVMGFAVMFVMGYSLNLSSQKIFDSQTAGHYYLFDTQFSEYQLSNSLDNKALHYVEATGAIQKDSDGDEIQQQIIGLEENPSILELINASGNGLFNPDQESIYISPALQELYGFQVGNQVTLTINNVAHTMTVADLAMNAKSGSIYMAKSSLIQMLGLPENAYTGILSMEMVSGDGKVQTFDEKMEELDRAFVSNRSSAVINQVIGCLVGCILIYLALLLNFQDSTQDILILNLMGYRRKPIRKMLIDIYKPIMWGSFALTLWPSILVAQTIQKSLSIQTGDYMPFQTNVFVLLLIFVSLNLIYLLVQATFNMGIGRIIKKEEITDYINAN